MLVPTFESKQLRECRYICSVNLHKLVALEIGDGSRPLDLGIKNGLRVNLELFSIHALEEKLDVTTCALRFTHFWSWFFPPAPFPGCEYKWGPEAPCKSGPSCVQWG